MSAVRWASVTAATVLVFPRMVEALGVEGFGLWAVLTTPTGMASLADLGIAQALVCVVSPRLSSARGNKSEAEVTEDLTVAASTGVAGVILASALGTTVMVIGWFVHEPLFEAVGATSAIAGGELLLLLSFLNLSLTIVGNALFGLVDAAGRSDVSQLWVTILGLANAAMLLVASACGPASLAPFAVVVAVNGVLFVIAGSLAVWGTRMTAILSYARLSTVHLRRLLDVGTRVGVASVLGSLGDPGIKWALGWMVGPWAVAPYEIASRLAAMGQGVFKALLLPLTPLIASIGESSETSESAIPERVVLLVHKISGVLAQTSWPFFTGAAIVMPQLMGIWLGSEIPAGTSVSAAVLLLIGMVGLYGVPHYQALVAIGRGRTLIRMQATGLLVSASVIVIGVTVASDQMLVVLGALASGIGATVGAIVGVITVSRGHIFAVRHLDAERRAILASLVVAALLGLSRIAGLSAVLMLGVFVVVAAAAAGPVVWRVWRERG